MAADGELGRIERLLARFRGIEFPPGLAPQLENGDDAAVLRSLAAPVLSTDCAVEGVHFRRSFGSLRQLSRRAFRAAASDLAAMGATPKAALSSLVIPAAMDEAGFDEIIDGIAIASKELQMPVVGGNLSGGGELSLTTTVVGEAVRGTLTRSGATAGDEVYVTGRLGSAAAGLQELLARDADGVDYASKRKPTSRIQAWLDPPCRLVEGQALLGQASTAIDISDGLLQDAQHLASASNVQLVLESEALPRSSEVPLALALTGGEDYELLFTMPAGQAPPVAASKIGCVREANPVMSSGARRVLVLKDGQPIPLGDHVGYAHF